MAPGADGRLPLPKSDSPEREKVDVAGISSAASFTNRVLIIVAVAALALIAWRLSGVFLLLFAGIVVAMVLRVLSDPLARHTPLGARGALACVVVALVVVIGVAIWFFGARLSEQFGQIAAQLPKAWLNVRQWLEQYQAGRYLLDALGDSFDGANNGPGRIARLATSTFGAIADGAIIVVLGFFLALEPGLYRRGLVSLVPPRGRARAAAALEAVGHALRRWLLGQGLAMLSIGVMTGIGLWALGIPMALSLAILAGVLEFVPFVGPIASAVPAILLAFSRSPEAALYVLLLYVGVQQFEGNVLVPMIQKWAVKLPPVLAILGVVVFGYLFGILGVLVATPLVIVLMVSTQKLYVEGTLGDEN
ncbi:MAG: AI-2E family transporter [Rhodospirillaceae bacterium]|nr:AI-2E family transporter [Rhodospirillaceae bacterium]